MATPHPSGLNRQQRRQYAQAEQRAARLDGRASQHVAALQETRRMFCEDGGPNCPGNVWHTEVLCPTCTQREGRPVYELRDADAAAHPEWRN